MNVVDNVQGEESTGVDRRAFLRMLGVPENEMQHGLFVWRSALAEPSAQQADIKEFSVMFFPSDGDDDPAMFELEAAGFDDERAGLHRVRGRFSDSKLSVGRHNEEAFNEFLRLIELERTRGLVFCYAGDA